MNKFFSENYSEARLQFLELANEKNLKIATYQNYGLVGAQGEDLCIDVAIKKNNFRNNTKAIVIVSGTHGIEAFCGSAIQQFLINKYGSSLSKEAIDIVFIHVLNPYGFSYLRRVNENNVDINRNFINFSSSLPINLGYKDIHLLLMPRQWMDEDHRAKRLQLMDIIATEGIKELQETISLGQYEFQDGIFYGGTCSEWSNITFNTIIKDHLSIYEHLTFVDIHTGLGEFGNLEIIHDVLKNYEGLKIAKKWFGDDLTIVSVDSSSTTINGSTGNALMANKFKTLITLTIEFGTLPVLQVFEALCADNWLHVNKVSANSDLYKAIKNNIKNAFFCNNEQWKELVLKNADIFFSKCFVEVSKFS